MTVVFHAVSAKSGGAVTYLRNLIPPLCSLMGDNGRLFLCAPPAAAQALGTVPANASIVETDAAYRSPWRRLWWDQVILRRLARREKADVLVSSSDFGLLFPPCRQMLLVRNPLFFSRLYFREILPRKSFFYRLEFSLRRWLVELSARHSDLVICASRSMLEDLRRFVRLPDRKVAVIPFGAPLERFSPRGPEPASPHSALRMLYVSEYSDYKNLTTLLRAIRLLAQQHPGEFSLTTTMDPRQFRDVEISSRTEDTALISDPEVRPHLNLVGPFPYDRIPALYREHNLFVFPSLAESFGHPLVEAMASGLPVVASDLPICREICGEAAVYFRPLDPENLAETLLRVRGDAALRGRMVESGRKRVQADFNWSGHVQKFFQTMQRLAGEARA